MSVITISRGSYSRGRELAGKLASALAYECVSREILLEASEAFDVPEAELIRAIHDGPSFLKRLTIGRESYISYVRTALLNHARRDNVVYHGLAGHFFLQDIAHVLKVRIIVDLEQRVLEEMKRENLSEEQARQIIKKDDEERRKWGLSLYGKDTSDSSLYDMVLHIKHMALDEAIDIIVHAVKLPCFQTTPESRKTLDNLALAAHVQAVLLKELGQTEVFAQEGAVSVHLGAPPFMQKEMTARIESIVGNVPQVKTISVTFLSSPK